jgi:hypothetical protein
VLLLEEEAESVCKKEEEEQKEGVLYIFAEGEGHMTSSLFDFDMRCCKKLRRGLPCLLRVCNLRYIMRCFLDFGTSVLWSCARARHIRRLLRGFETDRTHSPWILPIQILEKEVNVVDDEEG